MTRSDPVRILSNRFKAPPVADAGADQIVPASAAVAPDGSGSGDPDNDCLAYRWRRTSGAPTVEISGRTVANPAFTAPAARPPPPLL